MFRSENTCRDL